MARIPDPVPGLVFRYDFLRPRQIGRFQPGKERPACILISLQRGETLDGVKVVAETGDEYGFDYKVDADAVVIVPIQTDQPSQGQIGIRIDEATKRYVGLPDDGPSYALVSEVNVDVWPNAGIGSLPGKPGRFAYDKPMPGPKLAQIAKAFRIVRDRKLGQAIIRQP